MKRANATSRAQPRSLCPRVLRNFVLLNGPLVEHAIPPGREYNRLRVHHGRILSRPVSGFVWLTRVSRSEDTFGAEKGQNTENVRRQTCGSIIPHSVLGSDLGAPT